MNVNRRKTTSLAAALIFLTLHAAGFADKPKDSNRALPYRGMRMSGANTIFFVTKIEHEDERNSTAEIKIKFNIPADPRTLQKHSIHINGKPLPPDAFLSFNKAGNKIKILVAASFLFGAQAAKDGRFHIDLPEAKSFNRLPLYRSHFGDMRRNKEYKFFFANPPRGNSAHEHQPRGKPPVGQPPMENPLMRPPSMGNPPEGRPLQELLEENLAAPYGEYLCIEEDD